MSKIKYSCKWGATSTRKCLVPFNGNGQAICRLYELGSCKYDNKGNHITDIGKMVKGDKEANK